jgi:hypothetical protein
MVSAFIIVMSVLQREVETASIIGEAEVVRTEAKSAWIAGDEPLPS